jgi:hypothetical protein
METTEKELKSYGFKPTEDFFCKISIGKNVTLEICVKDKRTIIFDNKKVIFIDLKYCNTIEKVKALYFGLTGKNLKNK